MYNVLLCLLHRPSLLTLSLVPLPLLVSLILLASPPRPMKLLSRGEQEFAPLDSTFCLYNLCANCNSSYYRYREAELTHGRVAMLATVGFLVGEAVESKTVLFNGEISGPAITHLAQVNPVFWLFLGAGIAKAETKRAEITCAISKTTG